MKQMILLLLLGISIVLQTTQTMIPLTMLVLLILFIRYQAVWVVLLAYIAGLLLDTMLVRSVGVMSIYFLVLFCIVYVYQRKFEIQSIYFLVFAATIATIAYSMLFDPFQLVVNTLCICLLSLVCSFLFIPKQQRTLYGLLDSNRTIRLL